MQLGLCALNVVIEFQMMWKRSKKKHTMQMLYLIDPSIENKSKKLAKKDSVTTIRKVAA